MKPRFFLIALALLLCFLGCAAPERSEPDAARFLYEPNGAEGEAIEQVVSKTHERLNAAQGDLFSRDGYTLYAWNTESDGSGVSVGLGSRTEARDQTLYAQWVRWTDEALFAFSDGAITDYRGSESTVAVPGTIGGEPVYAIAENAFANCPAQTVILPSTLKTVAFGAFRNAALETLYLFDSIQSVSDYSFEGCGNLSTLHVNAAMPPVYAGSYYSTFADKYDRLYSLADQKKIVLFSGSSARFGYDSAAIDEAFPDYAVVNMGVFAYTNALPQLELIRAQMQAGDVLLLSPELDAAKRQFCTTNAFDAPFYNLMEANYDMLAALDLREYTLVFSSLSEYLSIRSRMEARSYDVSPSDFDEDGNPVFEKSYNAYGDYILYRPNAQADDPIYGLAVPYTASFYRKEQYIDPFNAEMRRFTDGGVLAYMTYSPRNRLAVSEDSTDEAIAALDRYFRETVEIPVISDIFDSLVSGKYLYGTDNHLSTEGVRIRTKQIISDLSARLQTDGINVSAQPKPSFSLIKQGVPFLFGLAALLVLLGGLRPRVRFLGYVGGFVWAAGAVLALVSGASMSYVLLFTLGLLLVAAYGGKRGMA